MSVTTSFIQCVYKSTLARELARGLRRLHQLPNLELLGAQVLLSPKMLDRGIFNPKSAKRRTVRPMCKVEVTPFTCHWAQTSPRWFLEASLLMPQLTKVVSLSELDIRSDP